jgi:hypothetical protein
MASAGIRDALQKLEHSQKGTAEFGHDFGHDSPAIDSDVDTKRVN